MKITQTQNIITAHNNEKRGFKMKKMIMVIFLVTSFSAPSYAENYLNNYGYYEHTDEVSAKDYIKDYVNNIFDFENSPNPGGESIKEGRYYVPITYKRDGGVDEDYLYVDDLLYDDTKIRQKIGYVEHDLWNVNYFQTNWNLKQDENIKNNTNSINSVNNYHTEWNNRQDKKINNNTTNINNNSDKIKNNSDRLDKLEEPQFIIGAELRLFDTRKWQVQAFFDYAVNRSDLDSYGIRFQYKFGKSYEEKRIDELERKIEALTNR